MPKKSRAKQSQKQKQTQNISIKIGELPTKKKPRRRPRKAIKSEGLVPTRQLPPVVYQTLPQLTYYGKPDEFGSITAQPAKASSIVEPVKTKTTILEDIGMVGTEGPVEIIDVPTKRETLSELITPVAPAKKRDIVGEELKSLSDIIRAPLSEAKKRDIVGEELKSLSDIFRAAAKPSKNIFSNINETFDIPRQNIDPVESGPPLDIPGMIIDPVETGPMDIPRMQVDPVESLSETITEFESFSNLFAGEKPSSIVSPPAEKTTIAEPKQKRGYVKSGKYSKKAKPEPQRPVSPLTFDESTGIEPQFIYSEGKTNIPPLKPVSIYTETEKLYSSPVTMRSEPTKFRENTPEKGFITQTDVNKFFEPKKRNTSPKPKPKLKTKLVEV
jgi:hypothetical protein